MEEQTTKFSDPEKDPPKTLFPQERKDLPPRNRFETSARLVRDTDARHSFRFTVQGGYREEPPRRETSWPTRGKIYSCAFLIQQDTRRKWSVTALDFELSEQEKFFY